MAPPTERFPCTPLGQPVAIWSTDQSGEAQYIATVSKDPQQEFSQTFAQAVKIGTQSYYFTYEGEDAFCPYLVNVSNEVEPAQARRQLARHLLVQGQSSALSVDTDLPPGFLLSPGGASFLFHASMDEALYLGDVAAAATFFTAVGKLGVALYLHWSNFPEDMLTSPHQSVTDSGIDQLQGDEALGIFFDWLRSSPDGDPSIADQLEGMIRYQPTLSTVASYSQSEGLVKVGPRWIDHIMLMDPERLLFATTVLRHEIVHQDQYDHHLIRPTFPLYAMALEVASSLSLGNPSIPFLSADDMQTFQREQLPTNFEGEIPAFAVAYAYQQLRGGMTPATTATYVESIYGLYMRGAQEFSLPSEVYDFCRPYIQYNIAQFLPDKDLQHMAQAILDIFDESAAHTP